LRETLHPVRRVVRWMRHQCDKRPCVWWNRPIARDRFNVLHETDTAGLQKARNDRGVLVHRHETAHTKSIERALDRLRLDSRGLAFIDLGCGQGTPLFAAPRKSFDRLIGVERCAGGMARDVRAEG
jgi:hypothetical protein